MIREAQANNKNTRDGIKAKQITGNRGEDNNEKVVKYSETKKNEEEIKTAGCKTLDTQV